MSNKFKIARLEDYFLWNGKLVKVVGINEGHRSILFQELEPCKCPHCGGPLENEQYHVIEGSPLFQENAKPISTIFVPKSEKEEMP